MVVAGNTNATDFPTTPGVLQPSFAGPNSGGFVTRINATGTAWIFSTYLCGSDTHLDGVQADSQGNVWILGTSGSEDFPGSVGTLELGTTLILQLSADGSQSLISEHIPIAGAGVGGEQVESGLLRNADGSFIATRTSSINLAAAPTNSILILRFPDSLVSGVSILGVVDSAGSSVTAFAAPGEFISLYGTGFGPADGVGGYPDANGMFSTILGGTQVLFDGRPMPLLWVSDQQINVLAPYRLTNQEKTTLQVVTAAGSSQNLDLTVTPVQPNIYLILNPDGTVNGPTNPVALGSPVTLLGSGSGVWSQDLPDGTVAPNPAPSVAAPVSVDVDLPGCPYSQTMPVSYAGAVPGILSNLLAVTFKLNPVPEGTNFGECRPFSPLGVALFIGNQSARIQIYSH